jgi:hypothetical protein
MTWQEAKDNAVSELAKTYFPDMIRKHGSVLRAAEAAGMSRNRFRRYLIHGTYETPPAATPPHEAPSARPPPSRT